MISNDNKKMGQETAVSSSSSSSSYYAVVGDLANVVCLVSTIAFALAVVFESQQRSDEASASSSSSSSSFSLFDKTWKRDGFCVTNMDVPYQNSHDWCLYSDLIWTAVLAVAYYGRYMPRLPDSMKDVDQLFQLNLLASAAHGMGHGGISAGIRSGELAALGEKAIGMEWWEGTSNDTPREMFIKFLPGLIFWLVFLKVILPTVRSSYIFLSAWPIQFAAVFLPLQFGFVYTQTVILVLFCINQLLRPVKEKQFAYASHPILTSIPTSLVGWMESTMCTRGIMIRDVAYGHLLYDTYTIVGMVIWYYACAAHAAKSSTESSVAAKKVV